MDKARTVQETEEQNTQETSESNETSSTQETSSDTSETSSETGSETTTASTTEETPTTMSMPFIGISVIQFVIAFLLIVSVLQQTKTATSITSEGGYSGDSSYWNKNKSRSKESKLMKSTVVLGILFFILSLALTFIK